MEHKDISVKKEGEISLHLYYHLGISNCTSIPYSMRSERVILTLNQQQNIQSINIK